MMLRDSIRLLTLAVLLCMAPSSFAFNKTEPVQPAPCKKPDYPRQAVKAEAQGISVLGVLVRTDGTVVRAVVLHSTGSQDLDRATADAFSKCLFTRPANTSDAGELWMRTKYLWALEDEPRMPEAKRALALAASKGSLSSRYHLSLLLSWTAETDEDRAKALVVLRSAAELGHAHAQFELGQRYEKGDGVETNLDEALRWYQKSAAQSDPIAMQRLALGKLME